MTGGIDRSYNDAQAAVSTAISAKGGELFKTQLNEAQNKIGVLGQKDPMKAAKLASQLLSSAGTEIAKKNPTAYENLKKLSDSSSFFKDLCSKLCGGGKYKKE